jgi:Na+/H+ antiporter NhaD/arsenite permease-like protein
MFLQNSTVQILGAAFFAIAVLHTFFVGFFQKLSHRFSADSAGRAVFHLLGEVEIVFGFWAGILYLILFFIVPHQQIIQYHDSLGFTEPLFIFCIMVIAATKPVLWLARQGLMAISQVLVKVFRTPQVPTDLAVVLILGPLSGSFITEPAAMTVTALLLNRMIKTPGKYFAYAILAVLFVNVSIGGALTPYAAPPLLMVAKKWNWDFAFVIANFGWRSTIAVIINALGLTLFFSKSIWASSSTLKQVSGADEAMPWIVVMIHYVLLILIVLTAHQANMCVGVFLLFLGITTVTKKYQDNLRLRESLLVGFFLGGLVVFGAFQRWWLEPLLQNMNEFWLFKGSVLLTAITDNAALTYLGSQVESLSTSAQFYLVAGALAGGG